MVNNEEDDDDVGEPIWWVVEGTKDKKVWLDLEAMGKQKKRTRLDFLGLVIDYSLMKRTETGSSWYLTYWLSDGAKSVHVTHFGKKERLPVLRLLDCVRVHRLDLEDEVHGRWTAKVPEYGAAVILKFDGPDDYCGAAKFTPVTPGLRQAAAKLWSRAPLVFSAFHGETRLARAIIDLENHEAFVDTGVSTGDLPRDLFEHRSVIETAFRADFAAVALRLERLPRTWKNQDLLYQSGAPVVIIVDDDVGHPRLLASPKLFPDDKWFASRARVPPRAVLLGGGEKKSSGGVVAVDARITAVVPPTELRDPRGTFFFVLRLHPTSPAYRPRDVLVAPHLAGHERCGADRGLTHALGLDDRKDSDIASSLLGKRSRDDDDLAGGRVRRFIYREPDLSFDAFANRKHDLLDRVGLLLAVTDDDEEPPVPTSPALTKSAVKKAATTCLLEDLEPALRSGTVTPRKIKEAVAAKLGLTDTDVLAPFSPDIREAMLEADHDVRSSSPTTAPATATL